MRLEIAFPLMLVLVALCGFRGCEVQPVPAATVSYQIEANPNCEPFQIPDQFGRYPYCKGA